jgi:hypothetical protein
MRRPVDAYVAARRGPPRRNQGAPGFIDLRNLGYLSDGHTFSVAHETVLESPDRQLEDAMRMRGPGHLYWTEEDAYHLAASTDGLHRILDFSSSSAESVKTKRLAAVRKSFGRSLGYLVPFVEFDRGVSARWTVNLRNDGTSSITCRADVSDLPSTLPANTPVLRGEHLKRRILTNHLVLEGGRIYPSAEPSTENPDRPAQAAAMLWMDLPTEFFVLLAEQGVLRSKLRQVEGKMDRLDAECLYRRYRDPAVIRRCAQLDSLSKEYQALNAEITDYDRRLREAAPGIQAGKLDGMLALAAMLSPFIVSREEMRFYVRFDYLTQRMNVIAILDKPNLLRQAARG